MRVLKMEFFNSQKLIVISGIVCLLLCSPTLRADITNGDFTSGLDVGWDNYYGVYRSAFFEIAVFHEDEFDSTGVFYLEQEIDIEAGPQQLSFDIKITSGASDTDFFNVTLGGSNIYAWNSGDEDVAYTTITHLINNPVIQEDMLRFELTFDQEEPITIVELDNVILEAAPIIVPAPGACTLGMIGIAFVGLLRKHRRV